MLLAAHYGGPSGNVGAKWILIATVVMLPLTFALALMQSRQNAIGIAITLFGLWWIGLGLAHAVLLRGLPHGLGVVIDVLVGTFVADTGAYFGGRLFGRRPLAARISPNKTVEGLLIGMLSCIAAVWLASRYESWMPAGHAFVLGLGIAVVGPIGDLFESFIKRQAAIKDSGSVFGAHGGALDRLDSLLFTAVVAFYIWSAYS
jgi:phosphatidate cytidylyltransferase